MVMVRWWDIFNSKSMRLSVLTKHVTCDCAGPGQVTALPGCCHNKWSQHGDQRGPGQGGNTIYYLLVVMVHTTVDNWSSVQQTKSANQINEIWSVLLIPILNVPRTASAGLCWSVLLCLVQKQNANRQICDIYNLHVGIILFIIYLMFDIGHMVKWNAMGIRYNI